MTRQRTLCQWAEPVSAAVKRRSAQPCLLCFLNGMRRDVGTKSPNAIIITRASCLTARTASAQVQGIPRPPPPPASPGTSPRLDVFPGIFPRCRYFNINKLDNKNCKKKHSLRQSVKVRPIKQQRSFCYVTRSCAFSVL